MRFKNWLQIENLSGPGGGPDSASFDLQAMHMDDANKGVGAFPTFDIPKNRKFMRRDKRKNHSSSSSSSS
jgi:hypothetical protein